VGVPLTTSFLRAVSPSSVLPWWRRPRCRPGVCGPSPRRHGHRHGTARTVWVCRWPPASSVQFLCLPCCRG